MKAGVVALFPGKVGFAGVLPRPLLPPPKITARLQQHPVQKEPLQRGFSRRLPHSASTAGFDLLFPRFIILFAISALFRRLHPSQPYSQLGLCLPAREMPSPQLKPSLDWMLLAPASLKPGYPQVCCQTAVDGSSSKAPRPSIAWCFYSSACPGNVSMQTVLQGIWEPQLLPASCHFSVLLPAFAGVRNVAPGINLALCLHFHPWP